MRSFSKTFFAFVLFVLSAFFPPSHCESVTSTAPQSASSFNNISTNNLPVVSTVASVVNSVSSVGNDSDINSIAPDSIGISTETSDPDIVYDYAAGIDDLDSKHQESSDEFS